MVIVITFANIVLLGLILPNSINYDLFFLLSLLSMRYYAFANWLFLLFFHSFFFFLALITHPICVPIFVLLLYVSYPFVFISLYSIHSQLRLFIWVEVHIVLGWTRATYGSHTTKKLWKSDGLRCVFGKKRHKWFHHFFPRCFFKSNGQCH